LKKVLITGSNGGLGTVLKQSLSDKYDIISTCSSTMDVSDFEIVNRIMKDIKPNIVIHCAAIVNADQAESNKARTYNVNVKGTENIAKACNRYGAILIFFSSDYVFNGECEQEYDETSIVTPINYYGVTKIIGEQIVKDLVPKYYILRVSWLFGPYGTNFLQKILAKKDEKEIYVVNDQFGTPTYTVHLAKTISELLLKEEWGIYNITNEEFCSWADYAEEILRLAKSNTKVKRVNSETYKTVAKRPKNSRLSKEKIYSIGIEKLPTWKEALKEFLSSYLIESEKV